MTYDDSRVDVVEMYCDDSGEFRWRRKDGGNHETIGASTEGYTTRGACLENITDTQKEPYRIEDVT
jgi:uncharacterized protein YegP (UPF0339 family)